MEKIFGKHSVRAVFLTRPDDIRRMVIAGKIEYHKEFIDLARRNGINYEFLSWPEFRRLGEFEEHDKHQGILILVKPRPTYNEKDLDLLKTGRCIFAVDQISNPQNFATIIRSAAFFGVDGIITTRNRAADLSQTVVRYAVGGAEFVKVFTVINLSRTLNELKSMGFWAYGLDERGQKTLAETEFAEKTVFVVGAEGQGLRRKTRINCDELVRIPGGIKGVESLNAAVAASIAMSEIFRLK
ncbi:MAG: 23S rRNA (guanosine(2251)-2'-O)-methyltransferase RlmB [Desulfatitalea sp.]|nr:23S rRNA (guanosine(2251)-2'-O)-methyltransferase RlmB [Desulfatitalea sp.]NNJ99532.1 23S rRNA (guanosine(2251)-2'-O)-methyltransferase RlmB [Desulfatitalea sp.]